MITPRPYQEMMITTAFSKFRTQQSILIQAATGAGKTIVFAETIRRFLTSFPGYRILCLVHREIIVSQNADKLKKVWPEAPIGIACASVSSVVDMEQPIVFGSIQTLASRLNELPMFHLVIVDEAHRLPPKALKGKKSQYEVVLSRLQEYYPKLRLFGLTATPFRLNWGPIYGRKYKRLSDEEPMLNWFQTLDLEIGMRFLQTIEPDDMNPDAPYLCGMRAYVEDKNIGIELSSIKKVAGEFNQGELSDLMQKTIHLETALAAYKKYVGDRKKCVIFAVDIAHAEKMATVFNNAGIRTKCVHSQQKKEENRQALYDFDKGDLPVVVNVGVMTEGWDCTAVDLLLLCRPTMSAALFVQIVGRGLRTHPDKTDVLILDLAGNFDRHGPPWSPNLPDYSNPGKAKEEKQKPEKVCPVCEFSNPPGVWCCQECGEILKVSQYEEAKAVQLRELNLDSMMRLNLPPGVKKGKVTWMEFNRHKTSKGADCLKVNLSIQLYKMDGHPSKQEQSLTHFFRLDGPGRWYFHKFWSKVVGSAAPETVEEAAKVYPVFRGDVQIQKEGEWWKVIGW